MTRARSSSARLLRRKVCLVTERGDRDTPSSVPQYLLSSATTYTPTATFTTLTADKGGDWSETNLVWGCATRQGDIVISPDQTMQLNATRCPADAKITRSVRCGEKGSSSVKGAKATDVSDGAVQEEVPLTRNRHSTSLGCLGQEPQSRGGGCPTYNQRSRSSWDSFT